VIHAASSGTYGSPRVHAVLRAHGRRIGRVRIEKLMRRAGIRGLAALPRRTRTTDSRHDYPIAPDLPGRNFTTLQPNQVWLANITYVATNEGWLYVSGVLDLGSRKLVGWSMSETLHADGALEALRMAIDRQRPPPGLIHHSDRGIQYTSEAYRHALAKANITPSMSRKGDCSDNAPMESFFHTLKTERIDHRDYETRDDARRDLFGYIECLYDFRRLDSALGYLSPSEYERRGA
jgi:putative transposase